MSVVDPGERGGVDLVRRLRDSTFDSALLFIGKGGYCRHIGNVELRALGGERRTVLRSVWSKPGRSIVPASLGLGSCHPSPCLRLLGFQATAFHICLEIRITKI